jgi:hypothetical protein
MEDIGRAPKVTVIDSQRARRPSAASEDRGRTL